MILYIEANHDGFATYQNKENNTRISLSSNLDITFISNPPAGIKNNSDPRKLQKLENSSRYRIEGTDTIVAVLSHQRIEII